MADPASYRPAPGTVPTGPGVYRFRDASRRVVYVGKAKNLRSRLQSYFSDPAGLHPRTRQMVHAAASVEWTVVSTEVEALQLEYTWIKEFDPRFNVRYRDDKSYPWLAVTVGDEVPRVQVMRGPKRKGVRYFGPYSHAWAIRETLDLLQRVFPVRTCSNGVYRRAGQVGRPCLLGYIDKCSAPCVGRIDPAGHRALVDDFCDFLAGQTGRFVRSLTQDMAAAARAQDYERAARLRDDIGALQRAVEKQTVVLPDDVDADVVGLARDELEAAVQVFHVRGGRVRGQRGFVRDLVTETSTAELVAELLSETYLASDAEVPREVLVPESPDDGAALLALLERRRGTRVDLRVPRRGDKRALLETVTRNAEQAFRLHKLRRGADLTSRSRALAEVQDWLDLPEAPLRIECFDVANLQGEDVVASMVVFEDGLARRSEYRRFALRGVGRTEARPDGTADDVAAMHEVVSRRFRRMLDEQVEVGAGAADAPAPDGQQGSGEASPRDPDTGRPRKFAYTPGLVVVDGGPPQVAAAQRALDELGVDDVAVCGLAKRLEEVWRPGRAAPTVLPRTSEALYLLQRVRDEAHRFANTYHRARRSRSVTRSELDAVPGLGETRRRALLRHFGSVRRLREAAVEEIAEVPGVGPRTAQAVVDALAAPAPTTSGATRPAAAGSSARGSAR